MHGEALEEVHIFGRFPGEFSIYTNYKVFDKGTDDVKTCG